VSGLRDWLQRAFGRDVALGDARWVVVDCETSGLDAERDRLLSIGAVRVAGGRIVVSDAFSALLRQVRPSDAANIVIHGIGGEAQAAGEDPATALQAFERYAGDDVLAAFHAPFDRSMLERGMREFRGLAWRRRWIDLARLLPALFPRQAQERRTLDDWLALHAIGVAGRHDALGDAWATAQLLQVCLAEAARQRLRGVGELRALERDARWLG